MTAVAAVSARCGGFAAYAKNMGYARKGLPHMTLADERLKGIDDPSLTEDRRALLRSGAAADLINAGQYEAAREALGGLWPGIGERPEVNNLSPETAAEVLLRCGTLTGWIGSVRGVAGAQEQAKDLLFEALRAFQSQGQGKKTSETQYELGLCYRRVGSYDEARVMLAEALESLTDADVELKAKILIRRAIVEIYENRLYEALSILREAAPVFESADDTLKARWHCEMGLVLIRLAGVVGNADYSDRAIMELTAAIYHAEQAGHDRYCGSFLNNLGMLLYKLGRYSDAHEHLDRAQAIFTRLKDPGNLAQIDETRARVLVAERKYREAGRIIAGVVQTFEQGGASGYLSDALTVQGVIWARVGNFDDSIKAIGRAVIIAEQSGALASAGLAAVTLIEEHGASSRLTLEEIHQAYLRADKLLKDSQDVEDMARLRACARIVMRRLAGVQWDDKNFSLFSAVNEFE
ncbi:MAG: tetratricopeptide repeat protein, partial [Acidobacteria bacterium]|nr:tetratricopeptide repeat protein [Acidobacteriota bacterium]